MLSLSAFTLIFNGVSLAFTLGLLLILLWYDSQNRLIQAFASFLFMVGLWNVGSLAIQAGLLANLSQPVLTLAVAIMGFGFSGASIGMYIFVTILVGVHTRLFRIVAIASLLLYVIFRLTLLALGTEDVRFTATSIVRPEIFPVAVYLLFDLTALYLLWLYRRRTRSGLVLTGMLLFAMGQGVVFLNPALTIVSFSTTISTLGAMISGMAVLQREIIYPLAERNTQVSTMHRVSLAISSQLSIDTVLNEIALQAAGWVGADGVGIFLREVDVLDLVNVYNLPIEMKHLRVPVGKGIVGSVVETKRPLALENYTRDWSQNDDDLPFARETFGSIIAVPLIYGSRVIGVLLVISGKQGRSFKAEDVLVLEQLSAQAAVAIAHSQLFQDVELARSQLETLLVSTENPMVAIDDRFNLIFANPAARRIRSIEESILNQNLSELIFPKKTSQFVNEDTQNYELVLDDRVYLCHLAPLGHHATRGWVAVMNDVTELIELDRMKSEMLRMVSHDLKNPLMGAMLYLDFARDGANQEQVESLDVIEAQLDRMNRIIRGVLDLERIRGGLDHREVCDARKVAENAIRDLSRSAQDKRVDLNLRIETGDEPLNFMGDPDQFERALSNLVDNAIKFTLDTGTVTVSVRKSSGNVVFSVKDTGIGIPEDLQSHVFERFFRGRQKGVEHVTGSGLGLSIVKTVVENHQGKIWLESTEGIGTVFYISVPVVVETVKS